MGKLISDKFKEWYSETELRFQKLKANEERLNNIFIKAYGLENELSPTVSDSEVSVHRADFCREIRSLISYAVGCFFGRYSIDCEGLVNTGETLDKSCYKTIVPISSNIITVGGENACGYKLLRNFVEKVYGEDTVEENLEFISSAIGGKGSAKENIQLYMRCVFFHDHCKIYMNKPIYWLFDSGRKNAYKALVYYHRLSDNTIHKIYNEVSELRRKIEQRDGRDNNGVFTELMEYENKLAFLLEKGINLNRDDGISENYDRLKGVLSKIY